MFAQVTQGTRLGHYELVTRLATGGMAEVWLARNTQGRGVRGQAMVKTILPHLADNQEFLELFHAEAWLAAALNHPNIVHFYELGEVDSVHYIAMEYIQGQTLRQVQRAHRELHRAVPSWLALRVTADVCQALHYAHELRDDEEPLGIVHRDLTPENIMLTYSGVTKVVDFGVAKSRTIAGAAQPARLTGKLAYLSPEQIVAADESAVDSRTDVYALGVLLYELLTGVQPFRSSNDMSLLLKIPREMPQPPTTIARWLPTRLSSVIMTALAKSPADRYQSAQELGQQLEACFELVGGERTERDVSSLMLELFPRQAREAEVVRASEPPREAHSSSASANLDKAQRPSRTTPPPPKSDSSGVLIRAVYDVTPPPREADADPSELGTSKP